MSDDLGFGALWICVAYIVFMILLIWRCDSVKKAQRQRRDQPIQNAAQQAFGIVMKLQKELENGLAAHTLTDAQQVLLLKRIEMWTLIANQSKTQLSINHASDEVVDAVDFNSLVEMDNAHYM
jgi:hypothetical protein